MMYYVQYAYEATGNDNCRVLVTTGQQGGGGKRDDDNESTCPDKTNTVKKETNKPDDRFPRFCAVPILIDFALSFEQNAL